MVITMKFEGITFDLWYTLIYETEEEEKKYLSMRIKAIEKGLEELGISVDENALTKSFLHLGKFSLSIRFDRFIKLIISSLGLSLSAKDIETIGRIYLSEIEKYSFKLGPSVPDILSELKKIGMKIAIISNTSIPEVVLWKILDKPGISQYVDAIISSSDLEVEKPNPLIFEIAQKRLGVDASRALHIGDSCIEDYLGALSAGQRAALYTGLYIHRREKIPHELCLMNRTPVIERLTVEDIFLNNGL